MTHIIISSRRWLHLPIETKVRELYAKLFLSFLAAERGWGVVLGNMSILRAKQYALPNGIIIEKSIHPGSEALIEKAISYGNHVSALCEEGLIYLGRDDYCERRLSTRSFDLIDRFFCWGLNQAYDISTSMSHPNDKIIISGNPRLDLLRPEIREIFSRNAQKIRLKYGNIILINTKFPIINFNLDVDRIDFMRSADLIRSEEELILMKRMKNLQELLFPYFIKSIPLIADKFKQHTIIIRPHPSESHKPYLELTQKNANIKVVSEGNANEWILASDVMVHNNCTTGVESFLLGKISISYRPYKDEICEHPLPNKLSYSASDEAELIHHISDVINNKKIPFNYDEKVHFAEKYISNIEGKYASEAILDCLDTIELTQYPANFPIEKKLSEYLTDIYTFLNPSIYKEYKFQKFPYLKKSEIEEILYDFQSTTNQFFNIKIGKISKDLFCIYTL